MQTRTRGGLCAQECDYVYGYIALRGCISPCGVPVRDTEATGVGVGGVASRVPKETVHVAFANRCSLPGSPYSSLINGQASL